MGKSDLRRAFQNAWRNTKYGESIPATLGRLDDDGNYEVEIEGKSALWNWITLQDGSPHEAINLSVERSPGLHIKVVRTETGVFQVEQVDATRADAAADGQAPPFNVPPHTHELGFGLDDPVSPRRIKVGLVAVGAGLIVNISPFLYDYQGEWFAVGDSTLDLTSYLPSTAGYHAWVLVYYNPSTQAFAATTGSEVSAVIPLTMADIVAITLPGNAIPLAVIDLSEGQTAITEESSFVDARLWLNRSTTTISADLLLRAATILTLVSGAVTVTRSHHIIAAQTGTADDLDTLNGLTANQFYLIRADAGDTITVKHNTGNIELNNESDFALSGMKSLLLFCPDGATAVDIGAGGGAIDFSELTGTAALSQGGTGSNLSAAGPGVLQQRTSGANATTLLYNFTATAAPTVNDDSGDGYDEGSWWFDLTNDIAYVCMDATAGAAVWAALVAGSVSDLDDLSDVAITTAAQGDILTRDATQFINKNIGTNEVVYRAGSGDVDGLAMGASTILARLAAGDIVAATVAQIKSLLAIAVADISDIATTYIAKALFDAHTILFATTDNTPAALTVGEQTVVGRATGGNISALTIDADLSSVSGSDDTVPSAKAAKTALDNKANKALDNLASVAINESLVSDTDNTDNLGSSSIKWANVFANLLTIEERSAPSTPSSGDLSFYTDINGHAWVINDDGKNFTLSPLATSDHALYIVPNVIQNVTSVAAISNANQVRVMLYYVPMAMDVNDITVNIVAGAAASRVMGVGIYDYAKNRLCYATFDLSTTGIKHSTPDTTIRLIPGFYWFAATANNANPTTITWTAPGANIFGVIGSISGSELLGTAANSSASGVPPSTLGTITGASVDFPIIKIAA